MIFPRCIGKQIHNMSWEKESENKIQIDCGLLMHLRKKI